MKPDYFEWYTALFSMYTVNCSSIILHYFQCSYTSTVNCLTVPV